MATFRIVAEKSTVSVDAKSSVHPIHGAASRVSGTIEAEVSEGAVVFGSPPVLRFDIAIESFKTGNALYDNELGKRLDTRRYPTVTAEARIISDPDSAGRASASGDITLHGVTQSVTGQLIVHASADGGSLTIEGEHLLDIRDFGLTPPKILMLKVYPEVTARIRLVAERAEG